jgi:catalase (peroxidase I)
VNAGLDKALDVVPTIRKSFEAGLTVSDAIVLAGSVALEVAGGHQLSFCGGRSDANVEAEDGKP